MEKAKQILIITVLFGVVLYFLPTALGTFGISVNAEGKTGIIALSFDGGKTFEESKLHSASSVNVNDIEHSGTNSAMLFAATNKGLFLSRDNGLNWYPFSDLEKIIGANTYVYDIAINPNSSKEIYVAIAENGKGVVYLTRDNFFTLSKIFDEENHYVRALATGSRSIYFSLDDGRVVTYSPYDKTFAFQSSDIFRIFPAELANSTFTIGGYSNSGLATVAPPRRKVTASLTSGSLVLVGSNEKLYRSNDYGSHWTIKTPIDSGRVISKIRILPNDGSTGLTTGGSTGLTTGGTIIIGSKSGFSLF